MNQVPNQGSAVVDAIDRSASLFYDANRLAAVARRDYELLKEEHEIWLEAKRTTARLLLEGEKAAGKITKQITVDMVMDQVRSGWPDEYSEKVKKLRDFQATVHVLESIPEAVKMRARSLDAKKDAILAGIR